MDQPPFPITKDYRSGSRAGLFGNPLALGLVVLLVIVLGGLSTVYVQLMPKPAPAITPDLRGPGPIPGPTPGPIVPAATTLDPANVPEDLSPVDLPIENLRQETQVWCWAAVSQQIIAASRGMPQTPSQCALVAMANGQPPEVCCGGQNPNCVTTGSLQQIQGLIQQFGGRTSTYAEPTDAMTLYRTLKMGHAVIIGIDAGQGMGHVVVARGMSFQQTPNGVVPLVHINDPMAYYTQPVPFNQVAAVWRMAIIVN
ncbi:papain-like cysteine protease family protein [Asticcacaulis sp. YBE204]|uniref:papain-like cysteine protease family protein n=1 Tax=Asticcacaulis sp. YBE204 TaxID=1282363 RepID=UPI0003C3BDF9|nr:papain-like cysteine protease family protein [Asticcacaulis sp. YBE204]ESQ76896.1 hypothetical protein AEYBE204_18645 [Asticcacaulis sp. YBE204]